MPSCHLTLNMLVSDIAVFLLKGDVKLQQTNQPTNPKHVTMNAVYEKSDDDWRQWNSDHSYYLCMYFLL